MVLGGSDRDAWAEGKTGVDVVLRVRGQRESSNTIASCNSVYVAMATAYSRVSVFRDSALFSAKIYICHVT